MKIKKCINCHSKLSKFAYFNKSKRCRNCYYKFMKGKNNPNWQGGWKNNLPKCKVCGKKLKGYNSKYCPKCWQKNKYKNTIHSKRMKNLWENKNYKKIMGKKISKSLKGRLTKNEIIKHHLDLNTKNNCNKNLLYLSHSKHCQLHHRAYDYVVYLGKIKSYIKWFNKRFGLC